MGSIDQSGSKDVVAMIAHTPCAIGYSGMAYAAAGVRSLSLARVRGGVAVAPTAEATRTGAYPLARRLYFYVRGVPTGETAAFIDWVRGPEGQRLAREIGFVPAEAGRP